MKTVAILCSDIHLSDKAPACRSDEPDWFAAMRRPLDELSAVSKQHRCPVLCAGDIFDRHNASPALISFALQYLPDKFYAIPGQHDLPGHRVDKLLDSAYGVCVQAGQIRHLSKPTQIAGFTVFPFQWGDSPYLDLNLGWETLSGPKIAINHQFVWCSGASYPGAKESGRFNHFEDIGFDICHFGDNHIGFQSGCVVNSGGFMRRTINDLQRSPSIWLLQEDFSVNQYFLDTSEDIYTHEDAPDLFTSELDYLAKDESRAFVSDGRVDFRTRLIDAAEKKSEVLKICREALEEAEGNL